VGPNETMSYNVTVYVGGDVADARRSLRRQTWEAGLCVTVVPCDFVFTGGMESGVAVGFINYPRFPKSPDEIWNRAVEVAVQLRTDLYQKTACVVAGDRTLWLPRDAPNESK
jgi:hypothetical protein